MEEFERIKRLPPYVFQIVNELKMKLRRQGEDIIDLGMGNPDIPTPSHIVDKVVEAVQNPRNHRYSASAGIPNLRKAFANWWKRRYDVDLDCNTEVVATMGAKDALAHMVLAITTPGDVVFVPSPTYPIHPTSVIIAGGDLRHVPIRPDSDFFEDLKTAARLTWPSPKMLIISFPHNPTTMVVDEDFFRRIVDFALNIRLWLYTTSLTRISPSTVIAPRVFYQFLGLKRWAWKLRPCQKVTPWPAGESGARRATPK